MGIADVDTIEGGQQIEEGEPSEEPHINFLNEFYIRSRQLVMCWDAVRW